MKFKIALLSLALIAVLTGCETYKKIPLMPDSVNYNHYFNDDGSPGQESVGASWNLGRSSPYSVNSQK